jgi:hypothetical protein
VRRKGKMRRQAVPGVVVGLMILVPAAVARGETTLCTAITVLPKIIVAPGSYCLSNHLTTAATLTTGSAITINADDVSIDLNGFKLESGAVAATITPNGISAVNRKGIAIRNGTIRGFYRGVYLQGGAASQGHLVEDLVAEGNKYAGLWIEGPGSVVRRTRVRNTTGTTVTPDSDTFGIRVMGAGCRVSDADVTGTVGIGAGTGRAVHVSSADGSVVELNRIGNSAAGASVGVNLLSGDDILVVGNAIAGMGNGVLFSGGSGKYRDNLTSGVGTPYSGGVDAGNNQ